MGRETHFFGINKKVFLLLVILLVQFICNIFIIGKIYLDQVNSRVDDRIHNVKGDISLKNDNWDLSKYNSDPSLLEKFPLYLFTIEGKILDRRNPIHGFLDQSNFNFLLQFQTIQTLNSSNNTTRRVISKELAEGKRVVGVVAVSYFNPHKSQLDEIDLKLKKTLNEIYKKINVKNGIISVEKVDEREIPYNIAFTVVDKFNTVLKKTTNVNSFNRIPSSLDSSYLRSLSTRNSLEVVRDIQTNELFMIKSIQIFDNTGKVSGVLVIGQSLTFYLRLLMRYVLFSGLLFLCVLVFIIFTLGLGEDFRGIFKKKYIKAQFDEESSHLQLGNYKISIPYSTNQYYLLQALFHKPGKRWETDELLERFGELEKVKKSRKVYDTMIKINSKVTSYTSEKLVINENKTYRINPIFKVIKNIK